MKRTEILAILVVAMGLMVCPAELTGAAAMGTAFTYQGRLIDSNGVAEGLFDFEFRLFDDPCTGAQQGGTFYVDDLDVIEGYFTVQLDFGGGVFAGDARWLQIGVRPFDSKGSFDILTPRQDMTPTPYSLYAENAGTDNDWMLSGNNMYSIPSGNVGIGTLNPSEKLSLYHAYFSTNTIEDMLEIQRASTGAVGSGIGVGVIFRNEVDNGGMALSGRIASVMENPAVAAGTTAGMLFETRASGGNMTDALYLDPDGKVGIGTTDPSSKLHIEGSSTNDVTAIIHNLNNAGSERLYFGTDTGSDAGILVYGSTNASYPGKWRFVNNKTSAHYDWITNGGVRMTLANDGKLGIGSSAPLARLFIEELGSDDPLRLRVSGSTKLIVKNDGKVGIGTLTPTEQLTVLGNVKIDGNLNIYSGVTKVMELGSGLDYAEGFDVSARDRIEPGSVLIIDPDNAGKLALSNKSYDTKVAGIVAGAEGMGSGVRLGAGQFDYDVALAGRVYCKVDAAGEAVQPGDLLTTSDNPGYAMKAADYSRAQGAILGKAMESLEKGQKGKILVLVTLQ